MRVVAIGDTHGNETWKRIVERESEESAKLVFIGDYWDSSENISYQEQRLNFLDICKYKMNNPNKVELLLGNHDFHYIYGFAQYSGYQSSYAHSIKDLIENHLDLFKVGVEFDRVLYTHAGLSSNWQQTYLKFTVEALNKTLDSLAELDFMPYDKLDPSSKFKYLSPYGDNIFQGPIWIRPDSLKTNRGQLQPIDDEIYLPKQVVGHTHSDSIEIWEDQIAFIDAIPNEYLVIEDGEFSIKRV